MCKFMIWCIDREQIAVSSAHLLGQHAGRGPGGGGGRGAARKQRAGRSSRRACNLLFQSRPSHDAGLLQQDRGETVHCQSYHGASGMRLHTDFYTFHEQSLYQSLAGNILALEDFDRQPVWSLTCEKARCIEAFWELQHSFKMLFNIHSISTTSEPTITYSKYCHCLLIISLTHTPCDREYSLIENLLWKELSVEETNNILYIP